MTPNLQPLLPMSMRPQAHDIIRTWAFYTIVKLWMHNKTIPWHNIVISGHVLADSKEKLSKSKDQKALSPEHLLSQYSADVIRYWTASGNLGHDVAFSDNQLKIGSRLVTKLWNAFRFVKEHVNTNNSTQTPPNLGLVNKWLLHEATKTFNTYTMYFEKNEFGLALSTAEQFFWHIFCDNYVEIIKDQLFNPDGYDHNELFATRWTLHHVGMRILQLFAPYMPFITEAIYGTYEESRSINSIHATKYAAIQIEHQYNDDAQYMAHILHIIAQVRKLKSEHQLSLRTELTRLTIHSNDAHIVAALKTQEQLLKGTTKAKIICYNDTELHQAKLDVENEEYSATVNGNIA